MRLGLFFCAVASPLMAEPFDVRLQGDFTGDGLVDSAQLFDDQDDMSADLILRLGGETQPRIYKDIAWIGGMGQQPSLALTARGSLQVLSKNIAIGRNRWEQVLTIAYRDGDLRAAGFTYRWYDTLNLDDWGLCDLNLLSGRGEVEGGGQGDAPQVKRVLRLSLQPVRLQDWPSDIPEPCQTLMDQIGGGA